jgi:hypothetical protein
VNWHARKTVQRRFFVALGHAIRHHRHEARTAENLSIDENSQFEGSSRRVENPMDLSSSVDAKGPQKGPQKKDAAPAPLPSIDAELADGPSTRVAHDRRRNCARLHRRCNDALLLGSRPSPALPNRSHYLGLRLRHWIAPNIQYLNLSITGASFCMRRQRLNVSSSKPVHPALSLITGSPPRSRRHLLLRVHCVRATPEATPNTNPQIE